MTLAEELLEIAGGIRFQGTASSAETRPGKWTSSYWCDCARCKKKKAAFVVHVTDDIEHKDDAERFLCRRVVEHLK